MRALLLTLLVLLGGGAFYACNHATVTEEVTVEVQSVFRPTHINRYGPGTSGYMVVETDQGRYAYPEGPRAFALQAGQKHTWRITRPWLGDEMPEVEAQSEQGAFVSIR